MNKVILIGNLTKDPEKSKTSNDISVCRFSIAVPRNYKSNEIDFFNIITWRTQADNCEKFLRKGSKVAISGTIQNRSYDANDGTKRYVTEIVGEEVQFLSNKGSNDDEATPIGDAKSNTVGNMNPVTDDDIPF